MRMCPLGHGELHKKHFKGVTVEECPHCNGTFFDKGEIEQARSEDQDGLRWLSHLSFSAKDKAEHKGFLCPNCGSSMESLQYPHSKVTIDKCPHCHGVWLDKGELDKVVSYLHALVSSQTTSELADDWKEQLGDVFSPHKSESEELKDLVAISNLLEERWTAEHPVVQKIIQVYYELTPFK